MSKVLKIAAEVVGAVALIATGVGALGGGAILGTTFATIGTIAGVAASVASIGAAALTKAPGTTLSGNQDKFTANLDQGVPYAIGRTAVSGFIVHRQTFDWAGSKPSNAFQTFFAVWGGGGPYHAVEAFQVDGNAITFSGDVGNDCAQGGYNDGHNTGWMWHRHQLGACPEPEALKAEGFYPYPAGWSATSKMSGYAAFSWTLKFDAAGKIYPGAAVPQPRGIIQGALVYDPRQDSTYPGGVGACRALVESTYVYSENPALHALTWALGRWQNGRRVLGIGMAVAAIVTPAFVDAANVADANGWKVGGVVYSTDGKWDVMKKIMAACSGEPLQLGGMLSCMVDTPRVSLATITDDDIIGKCTVPGNPRIVDRLNGVIPTCRLEGSDWQLVPCAKVAIADYVAADGKPRTKAITWELVQDAAQVAELATYTICNSREIDGIVLPLKLRWIGYKPGDALTVASSTVGLDNQLIVLRKRHLDPSSGAVTITSRTETTDKHAFALGQTTTPPPAPALQAVDRTDLLQPGISASWSAVSDDNTLRPQDGATRNVPRGDWNAITSYDQGDIVTYGGSSYLAGESVPAGTYPTNTVYWDLLAAQGAGGAPGAAGTAGAPGQAGASAFTLTPIANVALTTTRVSGVSTTAAWTGKAYTAQSYQGAAIGAFLTPDSGVGLDINPTQDSSYESIDYWFHRSSNGGLYYFRKGIAYLLEMDPDAGNSAPTGPFLVTCDGTTVRYIHKGTQIASHAPDAANQILYGVANVATPSAYADQITFSAAGLAGVNGAPGVAGAPGANGQPSYVHVAYANSADGSVDFVSGLANPGRAFIGIYTDANAGGSSDYHAYNWSRLTGQDGINGTNGTPGPVGANGAQSYVHFAYADSLSGSVNFTTGDPGARTYIGVYSDYTVADSNDANAYAWSLIKGADGSIGAPGSNGANGANGSNGVDGLSALNIHTVGAVGWDGHTLTCTSPANSWTVNGAYSGNVIPGGVALTFQRPNAFGNEDGFFGICQLPSAGIDYPKIDASWRMCQDDAGYHAEAWHAGASTAVLYSEGWDGGYIYSVRYDTNTGVITWYRFNSSGGGGAVASYNAGAGLSFGVMATAARNMSVYNVAFTAAGGTGATGSAGAPGAQGSAGQQGLAGPPGSNGVSPSPAYPAINISGSGTFNYGNVVPLKGGQTLTLTGFVNFGVPSGSATVTLQLQYSLDNGSSWAVLASGSDQALGPQSGDPASPGSAYAQGQYTNGNASSAQVIVSIRAVVNGPASRVNYSGAMQPS